MEEVTMFVPAPEYTYYQTGKEGSEPDSGPAIYEMWKTHRSKVTLGGLILIIIFLFVLLISGTGAGTEKPIIVVRCMDDWILHRDKCYYFSDRRDTWSNSQNFCESLGSSLAVIDNQQELDFLIRFKGNSNHWIGLSRKRDDAGSGPMEHWLWANGTRYSEEIFQIERLQTTPSNCEHVFLNDNGLKSENGRYVKKWICNTRLSAQPP